ncbi:MAG: SemiSWEET family sugar transporter [Kofleriaceae bacterium]
MPEAATIVGYLASVAGIGAFVPQLVKVIRTRDTKSLSTPMWITEVVTFALWTTYGVLLGAPPIIITNSALGIMSLAILTMKLVLPTSRRTSSRSSQCSHPA